MEYILINESKMKVMLEERELEELELSAEELDYANPDAKELFGNILGYAKEEFGFDTSGHRILLQLYPSRDGGCEIFITRLGKLEGNAPSEEKTKEGEKKDKKPRSNRKRRRAFRFERLAHLVSVCKRLSESGAPPLSEAFTDVNGEWFLLLSYEEGEYPSALDMIPVNELSFISEYGSAEDARALLLYLGEYGRTVCPSNAVERLSRL